MLQSLSREGYMSWGCHNHCPLQYAHINDADVEYRYERNGMIVDADPGHTALQPGAVIALPPCPHCGCQTFLKADYTLDEICIPNSFNHYYDDNGQWCMSALKHGHARNLVLHHMLYETGKAPCHPELPLAPSDVLDEPLHQGMDLGILYSLWWSHYLIADTTDLKSFARYTVSLMAASKHVDLSYAQIYQQIGAAHRD